MTHVLKVLRRRRWWALGAGLVPLVLVLFALLLAEKTYESTGTATVDVPSLPEEARTAGLADDEALQSELRYLSNPEVRAVIELTTGEQEPYQVEVDGDASGIVVTGTADSAREAHDLVLTVLQFYVGQRGPAAQITAGPTLPADPIEPDFLPAVVLALLAGVPTAVVAALAIDRRRGDGDEVGGEPVDVPRSVPTLALGAVGVVGVAVVAIAVLGGVQDVWAARPTTDRNTDDRIDCITFWLEEQVPEGAVILVDDDNIFWEFSFHSTGFPRNPATLDPEAADYRIRVQSAPPSPEVCGGYLVEVTEL